MSTSKNHHIVPQFYLNLFSCGKNKSGDSEIWVYNKQSKACKKKGIKKVCSENNRNTIYERDGSRNDKYEQWYSKIESLSKPIIDKIITCIENQNINGISIEDIASLIGFICYRQFSDQKNWYSIISNEVRTQASKNPLFDNTSEIEWHNLLSQAKVDSNKENLKDVLLSRDIEFFYFIGNSNITFLTSDTPIFTCEGNFSGGLATHEEIIFPLNPKIVVVFKKKEVIDGIIKRNTFSFSDEYYVHEVNKKLLSACYKEVYSNQKIESDYFS